MNSDITWVRPQKTKFFNEIVEPKQITAMTQMQSKTNLSTIVSAILVKTGTFSRARSARPRKRPNQSVDHYTLISTVNFTSISKPNPSKILLRSGTGLVKTIMLLSIVLFTPLVIKANLGATETTNQSKTEITKNSNTCGDRDRGNGTFDCNI